MFGSQEKAAKHRENRSTGLPECPEYNMGALGRSGRSTQNKERGESAQVNPVTRILAIVSPQSSEPWRRNHFFVTSAGSGYVARISIAITSKARCTGGNWPRSNRILVAQQLLLLLRRTTSRPRQKMLLQWGKRPSPSRALLANTVILEGPWQLRELPHRPLFSANHIVACPHDTGRTAFRAGQLVL